MARLDQLERDRIEGVFGSFAAQRSAAKWGIAVNAATLVQDTAFSTAVTILAAEAASATLAADAAAARNLYAAARSYEEITATAEAAASYQTKANYVKLVAGTAAGLTYGLAGSKNRTDAALATAGSLADVVGPEIHGIGLAGIEIGLGQITIAYIDESGVSDAQAAAIIADIHASFERTRETVTKRDCCNKTP
jgi:hypothetical protein